MPWNRTEPRQQKKVRKTTSCVCKWLHWGLYHRPVQPLLPVESRKSLWADTDLQALHLVKEAWAEFPSSLVPLAACCCCDTQRLSKWSFHKPEKDLETTVSWLDGLGMRWSESAQPNTKVSSEKNFSSKSGVQVVVDETWQRALDENSGIADARLKQNEGWTGSCTSGVGF